MNPSKRVSFTLGIAARAEKPSVFAHDDVVTAEGLGDDENWLDTARRKPEDGATHDSTADIEKILVREALSVALSASKLSCPSCFAFLNATEAPVPVAVSRLGGGFPFGDSSVTH